MVLEITYIVTHLCQFMGQNSKIWGGIKKIRQRFGKTEPLDSKSCQMPPRVLHPLLPKMVPPYSIGTCPAKTPSFFDAPSLLHQEKIGQNQGSSENQSTQMALESPKIDIC